MRRKYYGQYRGLVIQNNDPEKRGRVKIFVPEVSIALHENWNSLAADKATATKNLKWAFLGINVNSDIQRVIDRLKDKLPWAEISQPILGSCSSGQFNSARDRATVSDGSEELNGMRNSVLDKAAIT